MRCPYCGGEVSDTAKACGHCGRWLPVEPAVPSTTEAARRCPNCGQAVPATARACGHCGQWLAAGPAAPPPAAAPPKRGVPGWVWGLIGVAVVVAVAGALLGTAVIDLASRQAAPPPTNMPEAVARAGTTATAQPSATWKTAATATARRMPGPSIDTPAPPDTPMPSTDTPIPAAPTSVAPVATPMPALKPVTFLVRDPEGRRETVTAHQPVIARWRWGVCAQELLQDNLDALTFKLTVDGQVVATDSTMAQYRSEVREEDFEEAGHVWAVHYFYPTGTFESGSFHWLELEYQFSRAVTDGCDTDGDGNLDMYGPGHWQIPALRLELTVGGLTIFRDDFSRPTLDAAWSWLTEDPADWSLTDRPGFLRILTNDQPVGSQNLLVQNIPTGDFEVRTRVLFEPTHNYQAAGLVFWQDTDHYLFFGRAFCDAEPPTCVGNGIYFDLIEGGNFVGDNFSTTTSSQREAYLRMVRQGLTYTAYYSEDDVNWTLIGSHTPSESVAPWRAGSAAGGDLQDTRIPADFDFFELSQD